MRYRSIFFRTDILFKVLAVLFPVSVSAQVTQLPLHSNGEYLLERMSVLGYAPENFHSEVRPYTRMDAVATALRAADSSNTRLLSADRQYLFDENAEFLLACDPAETRFRKNKKPLLGVFYKTPANLFEVNSRDFHLRVNPMLNLSAGKEQDDAELIFLNQRGLEVRGEVDGRVFFYTNLLETQARFPNYVNRRIEDFQAIPGAGFYKKYQSELFNVRNGYDFNLANAYIGGHLTKHISAQFGHGRHFIGNGYRSLLLSDVGNNAFYLKISTRIWRLHYQNLFLELNPISAAVPRPANSLVPKKYAAVHYLSYRAGSRLTLGFFEATVFNRSRQFEFQYLNPIILYRTIEGMIGSPDNVLVGFDGHWNLWTRVQVYGQVLIDEFLFSALYKPEQKGWWGNKFGAQAGVKYMNAFGVDHLDVQVEVNAVRPYTYSSFDSLNSYSHYNQPLAHPLWANFKEIVGLLRYRPVDRLWLCGRVMLAETGDNPEGENQGADPLLSNSSRAEEYGNTIGQGDRATIRTLALDASWMLYHNIFLDLKVVLRRKSSDNVLRDLDTNVFSLGLRANLWNAAADF